MLLLWITSAHAAADAEWVGLGARVASAELSPIGVMLKLEVADLCRARVKELQTTVPCSPWRPLLPNDEPQSLSHSDDVVFPGGSVKKVRFDGIERPSGRMLVKFALTEGEGRPSHLGWRPEEGVWLFDGRNAGIELLVNPFADPYEARFEISGSYLVGEDRGSLKWEGGREQATVSVPAEEWAGLATFWMCRAFDDDVFAEDLPKLRGIEGTIRTLALLQGQCRQKVDLSRDEVCVAHVDLLPAIAAGDPATQKRLAPTVGALADFCNRDTGRALGEAALQSVNTALDDGGADAGLAVLDAYHNSFGFIWVDAAEEPVAQAVKSELDAAMLAHDYVRARQIVAKAEKLRAAREWGPVAYTQVLTGLYDQAARRGNAEVLMEAAREQGEWGRWASDELLRRIDRDALDALAGLESTWAAIATRLDGGEDRTSAACNAGMQVACMDAEALAFEGAVSQLRALCREGETLACMAAATRAPNTAEQLLTPACDAGYKPACMHAAEMALVDGRYARAFDHALPWCDQGDLEACTVAGVAQVATSRPEAGRLLLYKACGAGHKPACEAMKADTPDAPTRTSVTLTEDDAAREPVAVTVRSEGMLDYKCSDAQFGEIAAKTVLVFDPFDLPVTCLMSSEAGRAAVQVAGPGEVVCSAEGEGLICD